MKISTLVAGMAAGTVIGAALALGTEAMMPSGMKRDIKHYASKGINSVNEMLR